MSKDVPVGTSQTIFVQDAIGSAVVNISVVQCLFLTSFTLGNHIPLSIFKPKYVVTNMVDVSAKCKRGVDWFKGILKSVWELLKKIFARPRKSSGKKPQSGQKSQQQNKQKQDQQCDQCDQCDQDQEQEGQDGQEQDGQGGDSGKPQSGGEDDSNNGDTGCGDGGDTKDEEFDHDGNEEQNRQNIDDFHERVQEAEENGEFDNVDVTVGEESDEGEEYGEKVERDVIEPTITGEKYDPVAAALAEAFDGETTEQSVVVEGGQSDGTEVEIIDASEIQGTKRLTIIPDQTRKTRVVYD